MINSICLRRLRFSSQKARVNVTKTLRIQQVRAVVPLSKSRIYRLAQTHLFPPPIKLGERASAWLADEVDAWVSARARGADDVSIQSLIAMLVAKRSEGVKHGR